MLYSEFINGTGCRDNDHNYKVYKDLEILYMNSDMTKNEIYEYGKKLVNNEKPAELIQLENDIKSQIAELKNQIIYYSERIPVLKSYLEIENTEPGKFLYSQEIKNCKLFIKNYRAECKLLNEVIH